MGAVPRRSPLALAVLGLLEYRPLHPYGVQRLLKQWGKESVVNVGQRATLYKTMDRLLAEGLIAVKETGREQQYPERTSYELTDAGKTVSRTWMAQMLGERKPEFPEFPAALSFVPMLTPPQLRALLEQRLAILEAALAEQQRAIADAVAKRVPKVSLLDDEYLRDMTAAELRWVAATVDGLRSGEITWGRDELLAAADMVERSAPD